MFQSHTGRLTGLWFLPKPAFGLNTDDDDEGLTTPDFDTTQRRRGQDIRRYSPGEPWYTDSGLDGTASRSLLTQSQSKHNFPPPAQKRGTYELTAPAYTPSSQILSPAAEFHQNWHGHCVTAGNHKPALSLTFRRRIFSNVSTPCI